MPPHLIGWPKRGVFGGRWSPCFYFGWIIIPLEVAVIVVAFKPPSLGVGTDENYIHFSTIMKTNLAFLAIQDCDDLAVQILPLSHFFLPVDRTCGIGRFFARAHRHQTSVNRVTTPACSR